MWVLVEHASRTAVPLRSALTQPCAVFRTRPTRVCLQCTHAGNNRWWSDGCVRQRTAAIVFFLKGTCQQCPLVRFHDNANIAFRRCFHNDCGSEFVHVCPDGALECRLGVFQRMMLIHAAFNVHIQIPLIIPCSIVRYLDISRYYDSTRIQYVH